LQPKQKQNLPNEEKTETAVDTGDRLIETRLLGNSWKCDL
jgi:hypothetical protein